MKICLACSAGGHLTEILQLLPILKDHDFFFFTFGTGHSKLTLKKFRSYFTTDPLRKPLQMLKVIYRSLVVFLKERPDVIISTGANVAVPICILGRLFGSKLIFIECSAQVFKPSLSGRILYHFSDLFFVQWKYLIKYYEHAIYGGNLIWFW